MLHPRVLRRFGALDMGGASTEITFIPESHSIIQNIFPVKIGAYSLHLYSHSYLELGLPPQPTPEQDD